MTRARLTRGDVEEHQLDDGRLLQVAPYWDSEEVVRLDVRYYRKGRRQGPIVELAAQESTLWLHLRHPEHFRADGSCVCPQDP